MLSKLFKQKLITDKNTSSEEKTQDLLELNVVEETQKPKVLMATGKYKSEPIARSANPFTFTTKWARHGMEQIEKEKATKSEQNRTRSTSDVGASNKAGNEGSSRGGSAPINIPRKGRI